ncbi:hypothetical protein D3C81_2091620 [compost metagenome]
MQLFTGQLEAFAQALIVDDRGRQPTLGVALAFTLLITCPTDQYQRVEHRHPQINLQGAEGVVRRSANPRTVVAADQWPDTQEQ